MSWEVDESAVGTTLAAFLRRNLPELTWSEAKGLCEAGRVAVEERREEVPARRLALGERVALYPEGRPAPGGGPAREDLLVHVDNDVVVVRKPAGLLTVPFERSDRDTLLSRATVAVRRADRRAQRRGSPSLRAVQRLDKETSGLVVFARTVAAERALQAQLADHSLERSYLAIVHGEADAGTHETFLVADRGDGLRGSWGKYRARAGGPRAGRPPESARRAVTHVEVVERLRGATLLRCRLETGRQHQIRIHLAEAGHPLVGEKVYVRDYRGPRIAAPRPLLHAAELGFDHPRSGARLRFTQDPPEDFARALAGLRSGALRSKE